MRRRQAKSAQREPTIALINIVFLMLVFFLVAGTVARPLDPSLMLVRTSDLDGAAPADALVIDADGRMSFRGEAVTTAVDYLEDADEQRLAVVRIVPDRDLPAAFVVEAGRALQDAGAKRVVVVTERGLK